MCSLLEVKDTRGSYRLHTLPILLATAKQVRLRTSDGFAQPRDCLRADFEFSGFNFLDRANIQRCITSELRLANPAQGAFPSDVSAEALYPLLDVRCDRDGKV